MVKIHILGGSGSGKTTLAASLACALHVPHYDLDKIGLAKGNVTAEDAFAIAGEAGWISEGVYLIWTEPLLYHADYIILLEVPWRVAAWRMIRRHITRSLHGTNPYPGLNGIRLLFKLLKDNRMAYANKVNPDEHDVEDMHKYLAEHKSRTDPPTLESVGRDVEKYLNFSFAPTTDFVREYLERYHDKVVLVRKRADRDHLLDLLVKK